MELAERPERAAGARRGRARRARGRRLRHRPAHLARRVPERAAGDDGPRGVRRGGRAGRGRGRGVARRARGRGDVLLDLRRAARSAAPASSTCARSGARSARTSTAASRRGSCCRRATCTACRTGCTTRPRRCRSRWRACATRCSTRRGPAGRRRAGRRAGRDRPDRRAGGARVRRAGDRARRRARRRAARAGRRARASRPRWPGATRRRTADVVVECSGCGPGVADALRAARRRGRDRADGPARRRRDDPLRPDLLPRAGGDARASPPTRVVAARDGADRAGSELAPLVTEVLPLADWRRRSTPRARARASSTCSIRADGGHLRLRRHARGLRAAGCAAWERALAPYGYALTDADAEACIGLPYPRVHAYFAERAELPAAEPFWGELLRPSCSR